MDINATLLGQMITFAIFIAFTMKFVWPPLIKAMQQRRKKIMDGLNAAEQGRRDLEIAKRRCHQLIHDAKLEASHVIEQANERALHIVENAKEEARKETQRLIKNARVEIDQYTNQQQQSLTDKTIDTGILIAEKILKEKITPRINRLALTELIEDLSSEP